MKKKDWREADLIQQWQKDGKTPNLKPDRWRDKQNWLESHVSAGNWAVLGFWVVFFCILIAVSILL